MTHTGNPMLDDGMGKELHSINIKRYQANSKMWLSIIRTMSYVMFIYVVVYWIVIWRTWKSYPFVGIDPDVLSALPIRAINSAYVLVCIALEGASTFIVLVMCISGIISNVKQTYATGHWRVVLVSYISYLCTVIGKTLVLTLRFLEMRKDCASSVVVFQTGTPYSHTANIVFAMSISLVFIVSLLGCGGFTLCSYKFKTYYNSKVSRGIGRGDYRKAAVAVAEARVRGQQELHGDARAQGRQSQG